MREAFLADATELFERIERIVVGLNGQDDPREAIHELARCLHTLKGAAGSVGLKRAGHRSSTSWERLEQEASPGASSTRRAPRRAWSRQDRWSNDLLASEFVGYLDELIGSVLRSRAQRPRTSRRPRRPGTKAGEGQPTAAGRETAAVAGPDGGPDPRPASRFDELTDLASELIMQGRFWLSQIRIDEDVRGDAAGLPQPPAREPGPASRRRPGA